MSEYTTKILDAICECLPDVSRPQPLSEPLLTGNELRYVSDCIETNWVSSAGAYVDRFEKVLAEYTGARHAVVTVNGTAALHVALQLAGVRRDDEVLVPALTFVATSNAVAYCGAVPHFVDSDRASLGVDPAKLEEHLDALATREGDVPVNRETGRPIRALVVMHAFGHPVDIDPLERLCRRLGIVLIEDAAEALGSKYKNVHVGHRGRLGILSFNGNKIVTTGGGGAILTDDSELAAEAKHVTTTAKKPHPWRFDHDRVGYNYRLPNINAALGCAQMERLDEFLRSKRALARRYEQRLAGVEGVSVFREPDYAESNYWLNVLMLDPARSAMMGEILAAGQQRNLLMRPAWTLQSELPMYRGCPSMNLDTARELVARIINLPSSAGLVAE